jgi:Flp pilus assembly pilin Flp
MKQYRFAAWVRGVLQDEQGAVLVEYILLAILIGLAALAGMTLLGKNASNKLNNVSANIG